MADSAACVLGHTSKAMECPSCCGVTPEADPAWWRWYRGRTMSKAVKARIDEVLRAVA